MRILIALLVALSLQVPAWAGGSGWAFSTRLSSAGPLCVASVEQNGVTTGFYGLPFGPTNAFVSGVGLPRNATSTWQVGGYEWRQLTGAVDLYNGFHFYPDVAPHFLREVAAGSRLEIYLHDAGLAGNVPINGALDVSLRGSAAAITSLLTCQSGYSQVAYPALVVVETHWHTVPPNPAF
jgi:hypothetical protein